MTNGAKRLFETNMGLVGRSILETLTASGHEAYFVGGCVRDALIGRQVKDIDIATSALPEEVMRLYPRAIPTGLKHGTVTVPLKGYLFEVTTYRTEEGYSDGRRPDVVRFVRSIEEDLARRDFTMNAMALGLDGRLVDPFGGLSDLSERRLRCVGDPGHRFGEDALRMLRCVRFAAEYELTVEEATWNEVKLGASGLTRIAMERVRMELERMLAGSHPHRAVRLLAESGLLAWCKARLRLPASLGLTGAGGAADPLRALDDIPDWRARWALWLERMGLGEAEARHALGALRFSKAAISGVMDVFLLHRTVAGVDPAHARAAWVGAVIRRGAEAALRWLEMAAFLRAFPDYRWVEPFHENGRRWMREMGAKSIADLRVSGGELMAAAKRPAGPWVGAVLSQLLAEVALGTLANEKPALMKRAAQLIGEGVEGDERTDGSAGSR